jgi:hypothetical protein
MSTTKRVLGYSLSAALALAVMAAPMSPARAQFSVDLSKPLQPSVRLGPAVVTPNLANPTVPPHVHIEASGDGVKAINQGSDTVQAVGQMVTDGATTAGGVSLAAPFIIVSNLVTQPLKNVAEALANDVQTAVQGGVDSVTGALPRVASNIITMLIEAGIVFLSVFAAAKTFSTILGAMFRRRPHA